MVKNAKCSRCGEDNEYNSKEWKGREFTDCKKCHLPLTVCNGYVLGLMNQKEHEKFMKICEI